MAEFLLWEMKTTSPFASIQNRLAQYDISPKDTPIIDSFNQAAHNRQGIVTPLLTGPGLFRPSVACKVTVEVPPDEEEIELQISTM